MRLNFSHGTHDSHHRTYDRARAAAARVGRHIAIMQDLSGPKIRTGRLAGGQPLILRDGDALEIATGDFVGGAGRVSRPAYGELARVVQAGDRLLLDDGRLELAVEGSDGITIRTRVLNGGLLGEHKGINAPRVALPSGALTLKDGEDLAFGLSLGVDLVALSFVQSAADVRAARAIAVSHGVPDVPIVAKLERPEAIARLDEILDVADAVMVARGDLGLEVPFAHVPRVQKDVLRAARARGVPAIVATQVLESMREEPRPTRAEVSDAASAVDLGASAIMLAGETAVGKFPVRAVAGARRHRPRRRVRRRPHARVGAAADRRRRPVGPRGRARRRRRRPGDARPRRGHRRRDARGPHGADAVVGPPGGDRSSPPPIGPRWRAAWRCGGACRRW